MISCFDERKATQLAARFLSQADSRMEYIRLIKLLYIADLEALQNWGYPLTGDEYYSLKHGPIVSNIYDIIKANPPFSKRSYWKDHIQTDGIALFLPRRQQRQRRAVVALLHLQTITQLQRVAHHTLAIQTQTYLFGVHH